VPSRSAGRPDGSGTGVARQSAGFGWSSAARRSEAGHREIFCTSFGRSGADLLIGRRLTELYRQAGLQEIEVVVHAPVYPAGHSRRTVLPDLVRSLHPMILDLELAGQEELVALDRAVRAYLADPHTLVMSHLLVVAWGRKPLA
jgi:hypothetical protein